MQRYRAKSEEVEAITFDEFVEHGRAAGANIVDGMPWSFEFRGRRITHENDDCYLVGLWPNGTSMRFERGNLLVVDAKDRIYPVDARDFGAAYDPVEDTPTASPAPQPSSPVEITADPTTLRVVIEQMVKALNAAHFKSRERSLAVTKLQEASMWLNEDLRINA